MTETTTDDRTKARQLARRGWAAWEIAETLVEDGLSEGAANKLATAAVQMTARALDRRHARKTVQ
jgi:hypothetical protein